MERKRIYGRIFVVRQTFPYGNIKMTPTSILFSEQTQEYLQKMADMQKGHLRLSLRGSGITIWMN